MSCHQILDLLSARIIRVFLWLNHVRIISFAFYFITKLSIFLGAHLMGSNYRKMTEPYGSQWKRSSRGRATRTSPLHDCGTMEWSTRRTLAECWHWLCRPLSNSHSKRPNLEYLECRCRHWERINSVVVVTIRLPFFSETESLCSFSNSQHIFLPQNSSDYASNIFWKCHDNFKSSL